MLPIEDDDDDGPLLFAGITVAGESPSTAERSADDDAKPDHDRDEIERALENLPASPIRLQHRDAAATEKPTLPAGIVFVFLCCVVLC